MREAKENLTPEQQAEKEKLASEIVEKFIKLRKLRLGLMVSVVHLVILILLSAFILVTGNYGATVWLGIIILAKGILDVSGMYTNSYPKLTVCMIVFGVACIVSRVF